MLHCFHFRGRISLLHFCVFFLLSGLVTLIVGAVQFQREAELFRQKELIVALGSILLAIGKFGVMTGEVAAVLSQACVSSLSSTLAAVAELITTSYKAMNK